MICEPSSAAHLLYFNCFHLASTVETDDGISDVPGPAWAQTLGLDWASVGLGLPEPKPNPELRASPGFSFKLLYQFYWVKMTYLFTGAFKVHPTAIYVRCIINSLWILFMFWCTTSWHQHYMAQLCHHNGWMGTMPFGTNLEQLTYLSISYPRWVILIWGYWWVKKILTSMSQTKV